MICGKPGSLHHVYPRSLGGDDLRGNLVFLCGDGTSGHHGLVEARHSYTVEALGLYIEKHRPDTIDYLKGKLGEEEARAWAKHNLSLSIN